MPVAEVKAGLARLSRPEPTPALIERVPTTRDKPTQCASLPSRRSRGVGCVRVAVKRGPSVHLNECENDTTAGQPWHDEGGSRP